MRTYFHPDQLLHAPVGYFSRGKMRAVQEVPERAQRLVQAVKALGFDLREPADCGLEPLAAIHSREYLEFLQTAHAQWLAVGEDWGDEVMSNIFVRSPNAMRGILAQAGYYLADGSCPIGAQTWPAVFASAQARSARVASGEQDPPAPAAPVSARTSGTRRATGSIVQSRHSRDEQVWPG